MVSLTVQLGDGWNDARAQIEETFRSLDERFSLYRPHSELSRIASHGIELPNASIEVRDTYALAVHWRNATRGAFTPERPDGTVDLNGVVKAIAIDRAGQALSAAGATNWCVNAGGDILYGGVPASARNWTTGITDPADRSSLLTSIELFAEHTAVATSGFAERGPHIWHRGTADPRFAQVTVVAADIVTADVLSTAVLAVPPQDLADLVAPYPVDVLAVFPDGSLVATPRLREQLTAVT
ncbi:MAG: FAD:protein FMN transferase [Lacisediminihabitans sp.]